MWDGSLGAKEGEEVNKTEERVYPKLTECGPASGTEQLAAHS